MASNNMRNFTVHSPARICLYGDHQDYLSLPVIAGAIDRYMVFEVKENPNDVFEIELADLGNKLKINIDPSNQYPQTQKIDFFRSGLRVASRFGYPPKHGLKVTIQSDIPINAGVSSSSALVVGWLYTLALAFGDGSTPKPDLLGQMAYEAEVLEHQSPGGQMDQYTIAHGGLVYIETGRQIRVHPLKVPELNLILADSKIKKQTLTTIGSVREQTTLAIDEIRRLKPDFSLPEARIKNIKSELDQINAELRPYAEAAIQNHQITLAALESLKSDPPDLSLLGKLMSAHHQQLSGVLKVSHPQIDQWLKLALDQGAFGAKIVGSGHGGCSVLLTSETQEGLLCKGLLDAGVPAAYPVKISRGCHHKWMPPLVILAAGASSRMKKSLEALNAPSSAMQSNQDSNNQERPQVDTHKGLIALDNQGHTVIDLLIDQAIEAGITRVILVIQPPGDVFKKHFEGKNYPSSLSNNGPVQEQNKLSIDFAYQKIPHGRKKPLGTADALQQCMEQFPELHNQEFIVCNADNLYTSGAFRALIQSKIENALIGYDRSGLDFPLEKIRSFALLNCNKQSFMTDLVEKPDQKATQKIMDQTQQLNVSMNLWKFKGSDLWDALLTCPVHPERQEKELPTAVRQMIAQSQVKVLVIPRKEHVPDLTQASDIQTVRHFLSQKIS
jgi:galactokinase